MKLQQGQVNMTAQSSPRPEYNVKLTLTVTDPQLLWDAAASRLLHTPGMIMDDVIEMIGPREDPSVTDCVEALSAPTAMPGCALGDFSVEQVPDCLPHSDAAAVVQTSASVPAEALALRVPTIKHVLLSLVGTPGMAKASYKRSRPLAGPLTLPGNLPVI